MVTTVFASGAQGLLDLMSLCNELRDDGVALRIVALDAFCLLRCGTYHAWIPVAMATLDLLLHLLLLFLLWCDAVCIGNTVAWQIACVVVVFIVVGGLFIIEIHNDV